MKLVSPGFGVRIQSGWSRFAIVVLPIKMVAVLLSGFRVLPTWAITIVAEISLRSQPTSATAQKAAASSRTDRVRVIWCLPFLEHL
jgi:hypothetical protein